MFSLILVLDSTAVDFLHHQKVNHKLECNMKISLKFTVRLKAAWEEFISTNHSLLPMALYLLLICCSWNIQCAQHSEQLPLSFTLNSINQQVYAQWPDRASSHFECPQLQYIPTQGCCTLMRVWNKVTCFVELSTLLKRGFTKSWTALKQLWLSRMSRTIYVSLLSTVLYFDQHFKLISMPWVVVLENCEQP